MKKCSIVIGSLWGDEGKGHMTDILCIEPNTLNVRFNGGAQASHTVVTPDGKRHAFRHYGSGTFAGATTYLSEKFIVNMPAFVKERNELCDNFAIKPIVFVNPECIVTTPWDVYINQGVETLRGEKRHGSCGFGINETVERSNDERYRITVCDLLFKDKLISKLTSIQDEYVQSRLKSEYNLEISDLPENYIELITDEKNIDIFLFYADEFLKSVKVLGDCVLKRFENVVFEGAQGLLLDQNNEEFYPHVTTSNTGIKNVMDILQKYNFEGNANIFYMSRCYITKHGAGPMPNELLSEPYSKVIDATNIPNEFQGRLRYKYLDFDLLCSQINNDLKNLTVKADINLVLTCLDQVGDTFKYIENAKEKEARKSDLLETSWNVVKEKINNISALYFTYGLTRNNFDMYSV